MDTTAFATDLLQPWSNAIASRDAEGIAAIFDARAVFVATAPTPLVGRAAVRDYYAAAPTGLTVQARLLVATAQGGGMGIVADVTFDVPGRGPLPGKLSLACDAVGQITLYNMALSSKTP
jgi:ketosteroid isomerase-like protein